MCEKIKLSKTINPVVGNNQLINYNLDRKVRKPSVGTEQQTPAPEALFLSVFLHLPVILFLSFAHTALSLTQK